MKISYKHLVDNIKEKPNINDLSEKLFQLGHEHEIEKNIFDFEFTPNRGDCLSTRGILRDLNVFYETKIDNQIFKNNIDKFNFKFTNKAEAACPKITFLKIDIETIPNKYNGLLESYFNDLDNKKNNFFTDVSNYISYETGQPTHCYDASKLHQGIKLDFTNKSKKFKTLLDKEIELESGSLVFYDKKDKIINLAGVVGGDDTSCNKNTKSVIVECAYFNPEAIIGKCVKYSINSEAAHKFERHVDPDCHEYVIRRFIKIIEEHSNIQNIESCSYEYKYNQFNNNNDIKFDIKKINKILGTDVTEEDCTNYLYSLGFVVNNKLIHVPSYRSDIMHINDIAEEIARSIGYNNINSKKFNVVSNKNKKELNHNEIIIKDLLVTNGFYEVINDPFTLDHDDNCIKVDNPLDSNREYLRTSLKNSLLQNLLYNERRQQDCIKLFEISDIYKIPSCQSKRFIGIIASGRVDKNYKDFSKKLDKNFLENFLNNHICSENKIECEIISRDGIDSKLKNVITYIEIECDEILEIKNFDSSNKQLNLNTKYRPISDFPSSNRDLSFSIKDFSNCEPLQSYLLNFKDELLKEVYIFDYFLNEKNSEIKIGFRFIFQSNKSTITENDVNGIMKTIIKNAISFNGVTIPGLD